MFKYLIIFLLTLISSMFFNPVSGQSFRVMTYNLRWDNPNDAENRWDERKAELVDFVQAAHPDILGTQEGLKRQLDYISENIPQFGMFGVGREDGKEKGEYTAIFYNKNKFNLLAQSSFWLSETSHEVSVGWDAALPRICTYGLLEDLKTGERIHVFNTHFDHMGQKARLMSAKLIVSKIEQMTNANDNVILMGDFNCNSVSEPIKEIKKHLTDGKDISKKGLKGPEATFNGFDKEITDLGTIDHIFTRNFTVQSYKHFTKKRKNKLQLSDHYPVMAKIKMK